MESIIAIQALFPHPLYSCFSLRYLSLLDERLRIAIILWNRWKEFQLNSEVEYSTLSLVLPPNQSLNSIIEYEASFDLQEKDRMNYHLIEFLRLFL